MKRIGYAVMSMVDTVDINTEWARVNCGQCKHFRDVGYKHWGECCAPVPSYISSEESAIVWRIESHPNNYANDCEVFVSVEKEK